MAQIHRDNWVGIPVFSTKSATVSKTTKEIYHKLQGPLKNSFAKSAMKGDLNEFLDCLYEEGLIKAKDGKKHNNYELLNSEEWV